MTELIFKATNIKCAGCANNIIEGLKTLDGVETVEVEIETGQVTVTGNPLELPIITDKISSLGYPAA